MLQIRPFRLGDEEAVIDIWNLCNFVRPWNDPVKDIQRKLKVNSELFLVGVEIGPGDEKIVATVMAGYEGHRGWINYLAVHPNYQGRGYGRKMMERAESLLLELGCPKINLQVRVGNESVIEFYRNLGYQVDEVVSLGKRLIHDDERASHKQYRQ